MIIRWIAIGHNCVRIVFKGCSASDVCTAQAVNLIWPVDNEIELKCVDDNFLRIERDVFLAICFVYLGHRN